MHTMQSSALKQERVFYPDTDGQPMAENTLQYEWITIIKQGLEAAFLGRDDIFIAGDLFWYPIEGDNKTRLAPDVLVALGRPKGHRRSYMQWREGNLAPQVVFEVLSPGNRHSEMMQKFKFYEDHGVLEYYIYDPDHFTFNGHVRKDIQGKLVDLSEDKLGNWQSPLLGISFHWDGESDLLIKDQQEKPFLTYQELVELKSKAEHLQAELDAVKSRTELMAQKLRELGINPDELSVE